MPDTVIICAAVHLDDKFSRTGAARSSPMTTSASMSSCAIAQILKRAESMDVFAKKCNYRAQRFFGNPEEDFRRLTPRNSYVEKIVF